MITKVVCMHFYALSLNIFWCKIIPFVLLLRITERHCSKIIAKSAEGHNEIFRRLGILAPGNVSSPEIKKGLLKAASGFYSQGEIWTTELPGSLCTIKLRTRFIENSSQRYLQPKQVTEDFQGPLLRAGWVFALLEHTQAGQMEKLTSLTPISMF